MITGELKNKIDKLWESFWTGDPLDVIEQVKTYAGVSTAVLIFTKTEHGGTDQVWFYDMQADGFSLDDACQNYWWDSARWSYSNVCDTFYTCRIPTR